MVCFGLECVQVVAGAVVVIGFVLVQGKCELKRGPDFDRTKPDVDCNCLLKMGQSGDPSDVGFSQAGSGAATSGLVPEIENNGCCVGGPLGIVSRRMDLGECLRTCLELPGCLGADYNTAVCGGGSVSFSMDGGAKWYIQR